MWKEIGNPKIDTEENLQNEGENPNLVDVSGTSDTEILNALCS